MRALAAFLTLALLLAARPSTAGEIDPATARARAHFQSALQLYDASPPDYTGALAEFQAAQREKPSAGIKQNIALCLKALRRYPEAMDVLTELLADSPDLPADRRRAAEQAVADLRVLIATVRVRVRGADRGEAGAIVSGAVVVIDGETIPGDRLEGPLRLGAGQHVLVARAPRYRDSPPRTIQVEGGQRDVEVTVELWPEGPKMGVLVVRAEAGAAVHVDGRPLGIGSVRATLAPGSHRVKVITRQGDVLQGDPVIVADETVEYVPMAEPAGVVSGSGGPTEPTSRRWYVRGGAVVARSSLRLGPALDEPPEGTRRSFLGGAFSLAAGRKISPWIGVELTGELGTQSAGYASPSNRGVQASTQVDAWLLAPVLRFSTAGRYRFSAGVGPGLCGQSVTANLAGQPTNGTSARTGSGVNAALLVDVGGEIDFGRIYLQASVVGDLHGVSAVNDGAGERLLLDSPVIRAGGRLGVGIWF